MIIFTILAIFLVVIFVVFQELLPVIIILFTILFFYFLYQLLKDRKNFNRYFNKGVPIHNIDYVRMILKKIPYESRILEKDDSIFILNESGAYLLKVTDYEGYITGNIEDSEFILKINTKEFHISNQILNLDKIKFDIQKQIGISFETIVIVKNNCNMVITGLSENIVAIRLLYYFLKKKFSKKIYSIEQVDKLFDKVKM